MKSFKIDLIMRNISISLHLEICDEYFLEQNEGEISIVYLDIFEPLNNYLKSIENLKNLLTQMIPLNSA